MTTTTHSAQVPGLVADYFGQDAVRESHPVIAQAFRPDKGWTTYPFRKRVSLAWLRKMRRQEGVETVALECNDRTADFTITEIDRYARRPLLGGKVI